MTASETAPAASARPGLLAADARFALLCALGIALFPFLLHPLGGYSTLATQIAIVSIASIGFNLLLGYAGCSRTATRCSTAAAGTSPRSCCCASRRSTPTCGLRHRRATVGTAILAVLVGAVTVRLYGIYFALLTLAFAQMVFFIVEQAKDWTNGDDGLQGLPNALMPLGPWTIDLTTHLPAINLGPFGNTGELRYVVHRCGDLLAPGADVRPHAHAFAVR